MEPGKILATPTNVDIQYLSGVVGLDHSCSMRVNLPAHTVGSQWNVRFNTDSGPVEFDAIAEAVQVKMTTQLSITMDHLEPGVNSIEIDTRLYNGCGSTLSNRETLERLGDNMSSDYQSFARVALSEAFNGLNIEPYEWLDNTLHSREWVENEQSDNLRKLNMDIGYKLGWGATVPNADVAAFVSIGLGRDLLRYPPVRSLLIRQRVSNGFDSEEDALQRACIILNLPLDSSMSAVESKSESINWRPSTKLSLEFCEFIGLPSNFARAGASDDRPPVIIAEPASPLPPLLEFQSMVKEKIIETLDESGRSLVVMPTGSGKTRTSVESAISFLIERKMDIERILWLADRDELCEQAVQTFHQILVHRSSKPVQIWRYWSGNSVDLSIENNHRYVPGVVVTSTQQFRNRLNDGDPVAGHILASNRVVIIDEVHRNLDWNEKILTTLTEENPDCAVIGLTATPLRRERHETERLANMFNENAISPVEGGDTTPVCVKRY